MQTKKNINILLVDDHPENLISLENLLEKEGRTFYKATSGNEAFGIVLEIPIGLILLDVQMPEMDGFEVARFLKSHPRTKDIAIIFVTAISKDEKFVLKGFEEGAVDYLNKPLDISIVKAKVGVFETLYHQREEIKQNLEEIQNINKKLDKFVAVVSHDLKTPLNGIFGLLNFMEEDIQKGDTQEVINSIRLIKNCANNLRNMITGILEYSRASRSKVSKELININTLLHELKETLLLPSDIHLNIQKDLPSVFCEQVRLRQVFQNLIDNSIKHNDKEICEIDITYTEKDDFYAFSVKDNGPGIPPKFHEWIFELFKTIPTEVEKDSNGIGLSIVKTIVEDQGGKIYINSELGQGAEFIFYWKK